MSIVVRIVLIGSLALNVALVGGWLHARAGGDRSARPLAASLALDARESAALAAMQRERRDDLRATVARIAPLGHDLARALRAEAPDAQWQALVRQGVDERYALQVRSVAAILAFRATLSPAARERLDARLGEAAFLRQLAGYGADARR